MDYRNFLLDIDEKGIAVLTANNPDKLNAMNMEAWEELAHFFIRAESDESVRVVIITGAGEKAFIAGADANALKTRAPIACLGALGQKATNLIEGCGKPVIAAVNGFAFGGGCEIALACDIRIVSENAVFGLPEANLALLPGAGGTQRLARLVGLGRAKEMILLGRNMKADEAVAAGMAYRCVPQAELMPQARRAAEKMLEKGPVALSLCKKVVRASLSADQESGMLLELLGYCVAFFTEDKTEGLSAFLEKRPPNFQGK